MKKEKTERVQLRIDLDETINAALARAAARIGVSRPILAKIWIAERAEEFLKNEREEKK